MTASMHQQTRNKDILGAGLSLAVNSLQL